MARWPDDDDRWVWRLSLADVGTDGPISQQPGIDRFIVVASGVGMELTVGDGSAVRLLHDSSPFQFDGGLPTTCTLLDGPVVDLNLMLRRGECDGSLETVRVATGDHVQVSACVVLDGSVAVGGHVALQFDAITAPERVVALEPVRLALVTVRPL